MLTVPAQAGAVQAGAIEDVEPCETWTADITSIIATGPGTVTVHGFAKTPIKNGRTGPCSYSAKLAGYVVERPRPRYWRLGAVTGTAPLPTTWENGDPFSQEIRLAVGTGAVCVRTPTAMGITCDEVTVAAEKDGSPAVPVVGREMFPGDGQTGDVCGNCVQPPVDP
jgi:hypothetical protein